MRVSCDWDRADVKRIANWMHQTRLGKPTSWILQYFSKSQISCTERQIAPWNIVILRAHTYTHTHARHTMSTPRNTWRASKMPMFFALIAPVCMIQLALVKRCWSGYLNCVHVVHGISGCPDRFPFDKTFIRRSSFVCTANCWQIWLLINCQWPRSRWCCCCCWNSLWIMNIYWL